ncbi:hypothetical protein BSL78_17495 [Apostichopus japonicus]|uniref:DBF4-type domain-containing protein n=1 Tax=Stichopus japonicus TaxID=307972 RepID=A0A2G8KCD9_STIJA|nr:hypothetical protein BSL78_17495 [Apostichopus japonicus]
MSSLRGKKKPSKSLSGKDAGTSGKSHKTADLSETSLPLEGKVIYLDIQKKSQKVINQLKSDLVDLGATVEPFLSKDITHMFSDRPEAKELSRATAFPSGASPAVSTPSPFQHWKGSGATDSPDPSSTARMITRGRAIANKADTSSKTRGSTDVLNNARNMGIPIKCLDKVLTYVEREKEKLAGAGLLPKAKGDSPRQRANKKERQLQRYFLKVEDNSRRFRPSTREMDVWPRVVVDSTNTLSPFTERVPNQDEDRHVQPPPLAQTTPRRADQAEGSKNTPKPSKKPARKKKTTPNLQVQGKVRGYCECCRERYSDLDQHVESSGHQYFVQNQSNYTNLDAMINEGPNIDQFLNDCLQFQASGQTERTPHDVDEVLLISEAGQDRDLSLAANLQDTSVTPVDKPLTNKKAPLKKHRSPKSSSPRKQKGVAGRNKKRRSSLSPVLAKTPPPIVEETVGTRLSPRLRSKSPKQAEDSQEKPKETAPRDETGRVSPVANEEKTQGSARYEPTKSPHQETKGSKGVAEGADLGVIDQELTEANKGKTVTRTSPRRRKISSEDPSHQEEVIVLSSPRKEPSSPKVVTGKTRRKKAGTSEENQVGIEDVTKDQNEKGLSKSSHKPGESEKGGRTSDLGESSNRQGNDIRSTNHSKQIERPETANSHSTTREVESQTRHRYIFGSSAPGPLYQTQTVGLALENRNFPQGTTNTSTGQPFLGHAHTDFGLNPSRSKAQSKGHSEITGSEDERMRTIFRSDPVSDGNFEGFSNEEIHETEMLYDSFNKPDKESMKEKLKNAALDVVYVPSSELGLPPVEDRSDSDSESSEGSVEVDIVLQKVENFPSDGSEWETQVQGFMTKLDTALEVREKQTQQIQEELEKQRVELEEKKAALARESSKENQEVMMDQVVPEGDENANVNEDDNQRTVVKTGQAVDSKQQKGVGNRDTAKEAQTGRTLRKRVKAPTLKKRKEKPSLPNDTLKSPTRKQALREISNTDSPAQRESQPSFSTPKRRLSQGKRNLPHVTFSPKISVEDQSIILDNYVHDASEGEVSFPKLSSPAQEGWRVSPVKHFMTKGKPTTPSKVGRIRRRSCSSSDYSRPLLFLRLKVSPSSRRRSLPNFPDSPPPSPFKSPKHSSSASKKSPPIFALLYNESNRRKGLTTPILVTNRRPNFSKEILQPSLRLSISKRRTRRSSLDKRMPRTLAALNLSLPHIFDVFEFHDEASMDEGEETNDEGTTPASDGNIPVKTVECGTQTPPRKRKPRVGRSRGSIKTHPARRRLCIPTTESNDMMAGTSFSHIGTEPSSSIGKDEPTTQSPFEGSELARPFDLPMSFYM